MDEPMTYEVYMRVFSFDSKEDSEAYMEALNDAFMAMPESESYASVCGLKEEGKPSLSQALVSAKEEALEVEVARLREREEGFVEGLRLFVDTILKHGEYDDGCFYYHGKSASELEFPLSGARAILAACDALRAFSWEAD